MRKWHCRPLAACATHAPSSQSPPACPCNAKTGFSANVSRHLDISMRTWRQRESLVPDIAVPIKLTEINQKISHNDARLHRVECPLGVVRGAIIILGIWGMMLFVFRWYQAKTMKAPLLLGEP